jgi:hypothetical protein
MGAALGFLLAVLMAAQTVNRAIDRDTARARRERHQARRRAAVVPEEAVAARWPEPTPQTAGCTTAGHVHVHEDSIHPDNGCVIGGWPQPIPQSNPAPEDQREAVLRDIAEDLGVDPSPAALSQIRVPAPGWPSEEMRQRWLDDQDTHILSRPPDWRS